MYHKFVPHFRDSGLSRYSEADTALKEEVREVLEEVVKEVLEDEEEMRKEAVDPFAEENLLQTPPAEGWCRIVYNFYWLIKYKYYNTYKLMVEKGFLEASLIFKNLDL